jgi:(2Fe-2S) ferredoxin
MRQILKQEIKNRGWKGRVRVSPCGCVGMCEDGPVVLMYPQKICFTEVSLDDIHQILSRVEEVLKSRPVTTKG